MKKIISVFGILGLLFTTGLFAGKPSTPEPSVAKKVGAHYITVEEAKKAQSSGALLLDTRKSKEVAQATILGSKTALYKEKGGNKNRMAQWDDSKDKFDTSNIPADKSTALITFCNGSHCWRSFKSAVTLTKMGYTNVRWMRDGFPGWKKAGYPTK